MLSLLNFQNSIRNLEKNYQKKSYLLAVSGGVDSMVLTELFRNSNLNFEIAHINYHLRDEDSNLDEALVRDYCEKHHIPFHYYEVLPHHNKPKKSIENWARNIRYSFFRKILNTQNLDYIVTAHHLNDQWETFVMNLGRASGLNGLSGIPANENQNLRPLLPFTKDEIYQFATENNIDYREDYTNAENTFLRNKIRNLITPKILEIFPNFWNNFSKSLGIIHQSKSMIDEIIEQKINEYATPFEKTLAVINKEKFRSEHPLIQYEVLSHFGFTDEKEIKKIFTAQTGSIFHTWEKRLVVNRNELIIEFVSDLIFIDENGFQDGMELKVLKNKTVSIPKAVKKQILKFGKCEWILNEEKIRFPLILRHKQEGDFFYPKGMQGKKKVSKFFKDEKISILDKPKIWLLCDGDDNVLGVLPFRQDGRFATEKEPYITLKIDD